MIARLHGAHSRSRLMQAKGCFLLTKAGKCLEAGQ